MRTASGDCLLTNVTHKQLDVLEQTLTTFTAQGWVIPLGLVLLRQSLQAQPQPTDKELL